MHFISVQEAAKIWGVSERRVQKLCEENRIPGVVRFSRMRLIPEDTEKPAENAEKKIKKLETLSYNASLMSGR